MKNSDGSPTRTLRQKHDVKENVTRVWRLDSPAHCRDFLLNLCVTGKGRVTYVTTTSGKKLLFKDMDDSQIVFYANELAGLMP